MTAIGTTKTLSLRDVIAEGAGGPNHLDDYLTSNVTASPRAKVLLPTTRRSIDDRLHEATNAVLSRDVIGVLAAGWQTSNELRAAARRTLSTPTVAEFVPFLSLTISQSIRPSVRLFVDQDRSPDHRAGHRPANGLRRADRDSHVRSPRSNRVRAVHGHSLNSHHHWDAADRADADLERKPATRHATCNRAGEHALTAGDIAGCCRSASRPSWPAGGGSTGDTAMSLRGQLTQRMQLDPADTRPHHSRPYQRVPTVADCPTRAASLPGGRRWR